MLAMRRGLNRLFVLHYILIGKAYLEANLETISINLEMISRFEPSNSAIPS